LSIFAGPMPEDKDALVVRMENLYLTMGLKAKVQIYEHIA
jgi:hypothetical protein